MIVAEGPPGVALQCFLERSGMAVLKSHSNTKNLQRQVCFTLIVASIHCRCFDDSSWESFSQVMEADAVVLLGEDPLDIPSTWIKPGAAVIRWEPTLHTGTGSNAGLQSSFSLVWSGVDQLVFVVDHIVLKLVCSFSDESGMSSKSGLAYLTAAYRIQVCPFVSQDDLFF